MRAALLAIAFSAFIEPAAAAHCGHHRIYRVSMGICVDAHSRLAREVRTIARHIERPRRPVYYIDVLIPIQRPSEAVQPAPDVGADIPYELPGSRMYRPARPSPWVHP